MQKSQIYLKTMVNTATPGRLVLMLYDGMIRHLKLMKEACINKDYEKKDQHYNKAYKILFELLNSLNAEKGGEISKNLKSLYAYFYRRLTEASIKNNPAMIDEIIGHLNELRDGWRTVVKNEA